MALDRASAAHLLRRAAVGGTTEQIDSFVGMSEDAAIDRLFDYSDNPGLPGFGAFRTGDEHWRAQEKMIEWWVDRMITAPPTIEEKLTLFWHGHFTSAREKVEDAEPMWDQHVLFRTAGRANFRKLLSRVSLGPAMLVYLDNETNEKGAEQENFARELMELFTLGNGRFSEQDVVSMAKAWTGHNTIGRTRENNFTYDYTYQFNPDLHDNSQKTLFGETRNWDAEDTLDAICFGAKASEMSDHIARRMFQFYVHTNPSQAVIDELAADFRQSDLSPGKLLRSILRHDEFWADHSRYALVKSPAEYMVDIMRRNGLRSEGEAVRWRMEGMGMTLFDPPSVAGWGQNGYWLSTARSWTKASWVRHLKWTADERNVLQNLEGFSPGRATDEVLEFFSIFDASSTTRSAIKEVIETTLAERPWAMTSEPYAVGMFAPEVQCA